MGGGNSGGNFFNSRNLFPLINYGQDQLKAPSLPPAPPPPVTTPIPQAQDTTPELTAQQRAKKLSALRYGFASTVTQGMAASSPVIKPIATGKTTLGS